MAYNVAVVAPQHICINTSPFIVGNGSNMRKVAWGTPEPDFPAIPVTDDLTGYLFLVHNAALFHTAEAFAQFNKKVPDHFFDGFGICGVELQFVALVHLLDLSHHAEYTA